ncbi:MAG: peptidoglycan DD-metalloendopeptidase family protein [Frankiaceae bacterium]|nr:peptidoglycan DD-metalloendopeptidase family protein [Frankiaceae bacterium]
MRLHRTAVAAALLALISPLASLPAAQADSSSEARRRVAEAAASLEGSTAAVRTAAASLATVAEQLPEAQSDVYVARGELAGARARLSEATTEVRRAELATAAAQRKVDEASAKVEQGRATVGLLARRSYQQGPLGDMREVMTTGSPQDLVDRVSLLHQVFRGQNDALHTLSVGRLHLATATAGLAAQQKDLEKAREAAASGEEKARRVAVRAERAAARVAELVALRTSALADAEAARADDAKEYAAAQAASKALAARLKAMARARALAAARAHTSIARSSSSRFLWPTDGHFTSSFGWRTHPIYGDRRFHAGIDIGASYGTSVWSADEGTVVYAGYASGYGTLVLVSHGTVGGKDVTTGYAHMSALLVSTGQSVSRGQQVGRIGNEGNSTGPHLHFEVRLDGDPVDPLNWVSP